MDMEYAKQTMADFDEKYSYDSSYLLELMEASPSGFEKYYGFLPLAHHQEKSSAEALFVANLVAMQEADCGACLQLVVRMAQEAGVSNHIIGETLSDGHLLSDDLKLVRSYARVVANAESLDPELLAAMREQFSDTAIAEIALRIASARVFPTIKRAFGRAKSCSMVPLEV